MPVSKVYKHAHADTYDTKSKICDNKMYVRRTRSFSEQKCDLITVLVCIKLTMLLRKSCRVYNYT